MSFSDFVRILGHLLRGRFRLFQCYTNVNWRTCEACLSWHGRIVARPEDFPAHNGCPHELLAFPVWRLGEHRRQGERMKKKAMEELERREKWRRAAALLTTDPSTALALFQEAVQIDVYLPEVEELVEKKRAWLKENPAVSAELRRILAAGWKAKFAKERYERQPERARTAQERFGLVRLQELFS
ncbi:hypothetical protein H5T57_00885 [Candidatus Bipolaricaulota bacterium]|nr:hypothetical protein [Candidatus Bipolaricaulota bacterium]